MTRPTDPPRLDRRGALMTGAAALAASALPRGADAQAALGTAASPAPGLVALEEAFQLPELVPDDPSETERLHGEIEPERLSHMDAAGVGYVVLSWTSAGAQEYEDAAEAMRLARRANDHLAEQVARRPDRFGGFASTAMHDPEAAAEEIARGVRELGLLGAIVNDAQAALGGPIFYDAPRYDVFWRTGAELGVPVTLHPRFPHGAREPLYEDLPWLASAPWGFAAGTAYHVLRLLTTGVFDRVPDARLILGHMGEHIPYDIWRIDRSLAREDGVPAERTVHEYFRRNVWVTTSGHFSTPALELALEQMGEDRVMFSVDYPYVPMEDGAEWLRGLPVSDALRQRIGRTNALELLGLRGA